MILAGGDVVDGAMGSVVLLLVFLFCFFLFCLRCRRGLCCCHRLPLVWQTGAHCRMQLLDLYQNQALA